MWIPKSNEEIKNENIKKEKTARKTGVFSSIFFFFLLIVDLKYIGIKSKAGGNSFFGPTMAWNEILDFLPFLLFLCLFMGYIF